MKAKKINRRKKLRRYIAKYKEEHPCIYCGEAHIGLLTFHHRNPEEKRLLISHVPRQEWSINTLKKEIEKCDVLCVECHRKVHGTESKVLLEEKINV